MSLRLKLLLWYTGVFAVSACLLTITMYALVTYRLRSEVDKDLEEELVEWRQMTSDSLDDLPALERQIRIEIASEAYFPLTYRLRNASSGTDILYLVDDDLEGLRAPLLEAAPIEGPLARPVWTRARLGKPPHPFRILTGPLDPERHPGLVIQMAKSMDRLERREASMRRYLTMTLCVAVGLAALGGWFLAGRSLSPIEDTVRELSHVKSRSLSERLAVGSAGDELDRLRAAINGMLDRIESAFTKLQGFTADAAHELRTPIAALQCRLEVALNKARSKADYQTALSDALEQASGLQALADNLLLLARMDAEPQLPAPERLSVRDLCLDLAEPFAMLAEEKGLSLDVEADGDVTVVGDPMLLRRLVGNLLDNAVRYTPEGGRVTLTLAESEGGCCLRVADTGQGIEPEALEHIFDRFYRTDASRSREAGGAGLGLNIAKGVVDAHRGRIEVDSRPGEGTTVSVWLPADQPIRSMA